MDTARNRRLNLVRNRYTSLNSDTPRKSPRMPSAIEIQLFFQRTLGEFTSETAVLLMEVSIVIPTKNRVDDLQELLQVLMSQTMLPKQIIIVDDSDGDETRKLVEQKQGDFLSKGIFLKYLRGNKKKKSISAARNIGTANSTGDIVCFLDDDVILADNFILEIVRVYETRSNATGVQGYITNFVPSRSTFIHALDKVLCCFPRLYCERNKCTAFPFVYPYPVTRLIACEWSIGADSLQKRSVIEFRV